MNKHKHEYQAIITGLLSILIVGMVLAVGTLVYAKIEPTVVTSTYQTSTNTWNLYGGWTNATNSSGNSTTYTVAYYNGATTPYSLSIVNATGFTGVLNRDYKITGSNITFIGGNFGGQFNSTTPFTVTYSYSDDSTTAVQNVNTNVYAGLNLGALSPLVLAAAVVLGIVTAIGAFAYMRRS